MLSTLVFAGCSAQFYVNFENKLKNLQKKKNMQKRPAYLWKRETAEYKNYRAYMSCKKLIQKIWNFYGYQ